VGGSSAGRRGSAARVVAHLDLNGDVLHPERRTDALREALPERGIPRARAHVDRDGVVPCAERPHVQIVHGVDARESTDDLLDRGHRQVLGRRLEQHERRVAQQAERADEEDGSDREARDGVGRGAVAEPHEQRSHNRSECPQRVADEVKPGAAQVQRMPVRLPVARAHVLVGAVADGVGVAVGVAVVVAVGVAVGVGVGVGVAVAVELKVK
jgi:hypothetical protein